MLIIPVLTKTSKKTVPYVCVALVLLNVFIYFFIQSADGEIYEEAYGYYQESGLQTIELAAYISYLNKSGRSFSEDVLDETNDRNSLNREMFSDDTFMDMLIDNQIIRTSDKGFKTWRQKRDHFEKVIGSSVTQQFGYSPKRGNYIALLTCMFLHGGIMHLLGNMVFLWFVGAILEKAVGAGYFLVLYISTGICASFLFGFVYPTSLGPLIGASGAIAGLMGAYGVIFSLRKIRVFYSLGFYFDYATIPAISLFPVWLLKEIIQLSTDDMSNVAYMAHIGGLISGIAIGICYRKVLEERIESLFKKDDNKGSLETLLANGMESIAKLDLVNARKEFAKVLVVDPNNPAAIRQIYAIDKTKPYSGEFQRSFEQFMSMLKIQNPEEYLKTFEEYKEITPKLVVSQEMLEQLAYQYLKQNEHTMASQCVSSLFKKYPQSQKIPGYLLTLAQQLVRDNKKKEARSCLLVLSKKYGDTPEGEKAINYLAAQT